MKYKKVKKNIDKTIVEEYTPIVSESLQELGGVYMNDLLYLGKRSVYNAGNSKNISIPRLVLKDLVDNENIKVKETDITEVELFFDRKKKALILQF